MVGVSSSLFDEVVRRAGVPTGLGDGGGWSRYDLRQGWKEWWAVPTLQVARRRKTFPP